MNVLAWIGASLIVWAGWKASIGNRQAWPLRDPWKLRHHPRDYSGPEYWPVTRTPPTYP